MKLEEGRGRPGLDWPSRSTFIFHSGIMPVSSLLPDELVEIIAYSGYLWTFHLFRWTCTELHEKLTARLTSRSERLSIANVEWTDVRDHPFCQTSRSVMREPEGWTYRSRITVRTEFAWRARWQLYARKILTVESAGDRMEWSLSTEDCFISVFRVSAFFGVRLWRPIRGNSPRYQRICENLQSDLSAAVLFFFR